MQKMKIFKRTLCICLASIMVFTTPASAASAELSVSISSDLKRTTTKIKVAHATYHHSKVVGYEYSTTTKYYYQYSCDAGAAGGGTLLLYHYPTDRQTRSFQLVYNGTRLYAKIYQSTGTGTLLGTLYFYK